MQSYLYIWAILVCGIAVVIGFRRGIRRSHLQRLQLTPTEAKIQALIRDIYGGRILRERIVSRSNEHVMVAKLRGGEKLVINLSQLGLKHESGMSLAALRTALGPFP